MTVKRRRPTAKRLAGLLADVVITQQLKQRPSREFDLQDQVNAFRELADHLAKNPDTFLNRLVDLALTLCDADTVGISVEETDGKGEPIFRWVAMAGELKSLVGGSTPRNFSPCGVCVDQNRPLLMDHLDRFYPYFKDAPLPFVEALLIPWQVSGGPVGTLWIVAHTDRRKFDQQDALLMSGLAAFASVAMRLRHSVLESERGVVAARLVSAIAHEINNPLQGAILALSCAASSSGLSSEVRTMISTAEKEMHRVAALSSEIIRKSA